MTAAAGMPGRRPLAGPHPAQRRLRHLFNPATGWFRSLERWVNHQLSLRVYPRVPLLARPYSAQLDRRLTVSEARIEIPQLPAGFIDTTILLVTDVHAGPFLRCEAIERTFQRLQGLDADLILLGGDFVTSRLEEVGVLEPGLGRLRAPLGVFAVLGNHDHYTGRAGELIRRVEDTGVRVLHNRHCVLRRNGDEVRLAGIDDWIMGRPDLDAALPSGCGRPTLLLSHNPDAFFEAQRRGVSLVLSGHTHGGQIRLPGLPVLVRMSRYRLDEGRYSYGASELVVSRGLGVTGLPLRWHCPPEAVLLRLASRVE